MRLLGAVRKLLGRDEVPPGFTGRLAADEHVLGSAALAGSADTHSADTHSADAARGADAGSGDAARGGHLVVTTLGLWLPGRERLGWHLVSKASWQGGAIALVEAREVEVVGGAVIIEDLPAVRLRLADPGRVPEVVHARVTGSIRSRHHRELPAGAGAAGGAWFVQRKVPGRDGFVLQVRPDPGTDPAAVRQVAGDVARTLGPKPRRAGTPPST